MSWEDILKQKFNFNNLKFRAQGDKRNPRGWSAYHEFTNGGYFSIIMGEGTWSKPEKYLEDPMAYQSYEVAFRHPLFNEFEMQHELEIGFGIKYDNMAAMEFDNIFKYITKEKISEFAKIIEETPTSVAKERIENFSWDYDEEKELTVEDIDEMIEDLKTDRMGLTLEQVNRLIEIYEDKKKDLQEGKR